MISSSRIALFAALLVCLAQASRVQSQAATDAPVADPMGANTSSPDEQTTLGGDQGAPETPEEELEEAKWEMEQVAQDCEILRQMLEEPTADGQPDVELEYALEGCQEYLNQISVDVEMLTAEVEGGNSTDTSSSSSGAETTTAALPAGQ